MAWRISWKSQNLHFCGADLAVSDWQTCILRGVLGLLLLGRVSFQAKSLHFGGVLDGSRSTRIADLGAMWRLRQARRSNSPTQCEWESPVARVQVSRMARLVIDKFFEGLRSVAPEGVWFLWDNVIRVASAGGWSSDLCGGLGRDGVGLRWASGGLFWHTGLWEGRDWFTLCHVLSQHHQK